MPWQALSEFSISGTNRPIEWLRQVRFAKTFEIVQELIADEEALRKDSTELVRQLQTIRFCENHRKKWRKLQARLSAGTDLAPHDAVLEEDDEVSEELRDQIRAWQCRWEASTKLTREAKSVFQSELQEKRAALWSLAADPAFKKGVFELNPDFLEHIEGYLSRWEQISRDSEMRKKENTLVSYLTRFCTKNSVAGSLGPTFGGVLSSSDKSLAVSWNDKASHEEGIDQTEAFYAYWAIQALADAIGRCDTIRLLLPLRIHPAVTTLNHELISSVVLPKHEFTPATERVALSSDTFDAVQRINGALSGSEVLDGMKLEGERRELVQKDLLALIRSRFLLDGLIIPPGTVHFLRYLQDLLRSISFENDECRSWKRTLDQFEDLRTQFKSEPFDNKRQILKEVEALFREKTSLEASRGAGAYYADRYILFEDCRRACTPLQIGGELKKEILDNYTFALELLAPFWLFQILPAALTIQNDIPTLQKRLASTTNETEKTAELARFAHKLFGSIRQPLSEEMKEKKNVIRWLLAFSGLVRMSRDILSRVDTTTHEALLDSNDSTLKAYRSKFAEVLASGNPLLPVFASGPIMQLAAKGLEEISRGDFSLIFDSVIFGNSMNLTVMNYFSTDRVKQLGESERVLKELLGLRNERLADFTMFGSQQSKFTPWIRGGVDIEFCGSSFKDVSDRVSLREVFSGGPTSKALKMRVKNRWCSLRIGIPHAARLSRKLIVEDFESHYPRLRIGRTILQRENWRFEGKQIVPKPRKENDPFADYVDLIRFKVKNNLPDYVFVDPSGPKKNILIDFQNFFLVEVLFGLARGNESLRFSEMLPDPDQFWLQSPDSEAMHYTVGFMPFLYFQPEKRPTRRKN
jgi:hypothetical protein